MAEWVEIRDGGQLLYEPNFCTREQADVLFAWLRTGVPWKQETVRGIPLPRLNACLDGVPVVVRIDTVD